MGQTFHDLRRSAVRNLIRAGVDRTVAKRFSGHATDSMFERFNVMDETDLRAAVAKVSAYVESLPATDTDKTRTGTESDANVAHYLERQLAEAGRNRTYRSGD